MSVDIVDDLHYAEDRIGQLEAAIRRHIGPADRHTPALYSELRALIDEDYCRPSCEAGKEYDDEHDPDCGCPCHEAEDDDGYAGRREPHADLQRWD